MAKKKAATAATTTTAAPNMNQYEAMFLFGSAAAAEVDKSIATARGIIERHGGQVLVAKKWDERKLLYEIKGNKRGLYIITYFSAPGTAVAGIERDVNLSEEVVRVLVTDPTHVAHWGVFVTTPEASSTSANGGASSSSGTQSKVQPASISSRKA